MRDLVLSLGSFDSYVDLEDSQYCDTQIEYWIRSDSCHFVECDREIVVQFPHVLTKPTQILDKMKGLLLPLYLCIVFKV